MDYMLDFKDCVVVHHSSNGRIVFASGASLSHLEHIPQETRTKKTSRKKQELLDFLAVHSSSIGDLVTD